MLHIFIAFASLLAATYAFFKPTTSSLFSNYGLIAATIASGFLMVIVEPSRMLHACITGIVYIVGISLASVVIHRRIVSLRNRDAVL